MSYFRWKGIDTAGRDLTGLILAPTREAAELALMYQGILTVKVTQTLSQSTRAQNKFLRELIAQLALFTSHGLPLYQALTIIAHQTNKMYNKANIESLLTELRAGGTFAESIALLFPQSPPYIGALIQSGEKSGRLDKIFATLSTYLEQQARLGKKIHAALLPPALTLAFTGAIITILLIAVAPQFERLFATLGKELPPATQTLLGASHMMQDPFSWGIALLLIGGSFLLYKLASRFTIRDLLLMKLPIAGSYIAKAELSRFLAIVGILSDSTLPLYQAALLAQAALSNKVIKLWLDLPIKKIAQGKSLIEGTQELPAPYNLLLSDLLSPTTLLGVHQKTVALAVERLDEENARSISKILALISPILLTFVGGIILGILIFLYLPLFSLANNI